jgi:hypothetical protein
MLIRLSSFMLCFLVFAVAASAQTGQNGVTAKVANAPAAAGVLLDWDATRREASRRRPAVPIEDLRPLEQGRVRP